MRALLRWLLCLLIAGLALELFFVARIALMAVIDPQSTSFQRSAAWKIANGGSALTGSAHTTSAEARPRSAGGQRPPVKAQQGLSNWRQRWVPYDQLADSLKRAVIASEDADFISHDGVEWEAIEKARQRNAKAEELATRRAVQANANGKPARAPKLRGGSTLTQQLAKNLLLSGERTLLRKGQELVLATTLELLLDKRRILELYLNNVEWGDGLFGAQAAAEYYFGKPASRLTAAEAARLAVMLPSPTFFQHRPDSPYLNRRAATIVARMPAVQLP